MTDAGAHLARTTESDVTERSTHLPSVIETEARRCRSLTKAGNPCKSPTVGADGYCGIHRPGVDPAALGQRGGLASGEIRREQGKSVRDRLRDKVEAEFDVIAAAFDAGLASEDERVRVASAQALLAEACGRPAQQIVGDAERPVAFLFESLLSRAGGES